MKRCEKCRVTVAGNRTECPLCQGILSPAEGEQEERFPYVPTVYRKNHLFFKILIFLSITAGVISAAVNLMIPQSGIWSLMVIAGLGCAWLAIATAIRKRRNILKNILYQVVLISLIVAAWDWLTGWRGWSIDYVIPILCLSAMLIMVVLAKATHLDRADCTIYFILDGLFGVVPLVLWLTGCLKAVYPSFICSAGSIITLAAWLIFEGNGAKTELKKRLHV